MFFKFNLSKFWKYFSTIFVIFQIIFFKSVICLENTIINQNSSSIVKIINNRNEENQFPLKLPTDIIPLEYNIDLETEIHSGSFKFYGFVNIRIYVENSTDRIIINAQLLNNFSISLIDLDSGENHDNIIYNYNDEYLLIYMNFMLHSKTEYLLRISYCGVLSTEPNGFYRINYTDDKNRKMWVAATQFKPFYARKAFPCFDEPQFKAKFTLTLTHGSNYSALSNMPSENTPLSFDHNLKTTKFIRTPLIPTYNLAFIITNFDYIYDVKDRKFHRIHSPLYKIKENGIFSLTVSTHSLYEFEKYLEIPYPLNKIDHVALQLHSRKQSIENLGLLSYNENDLLMNDEESGEKDNYYKLKTLIDINYKIGNQWFGNLVTPKWWNYTWMTEGFSTLFSYEISNVIYPKWNIKEFQLFQMSDTGYYLLEDEDLPLTRSMQTPEEINSAFSLTTYYKTANILQMFKYALTPKAFKHGIIRYLKKFQYTAVSGTDLFSCLEASAKLYSIPFFKENMAIERSMGSWIFQAGYPILTVTRNYNSESFTIHQEPYDDDFEELWWIPINFATSKEPNFEQTQNEFFLPRVRSITINPAIGKLKISKDDWLMLNNQQTGYYVTNYDEHNWILIAQFLRQQKSIIHEFNKAQIFRDLNILLDKDLISIRIILEMLAYLEKETDLTVWNSAVQLLTNLNWKLEGRPIQNEYHKFVRKIIDLIFKQLGCNEINDESPYREYVRKNIFNLACSVKLPKCLLCAKTEILDYMQNLQIQPFYLKRSILCHRLKTADKNLFQSIFQKLLNNITNLQERDDIIYGLSCTNNLDLNSFLLDNIINNNCFYEIERSKVIFYTYFNNKNYRNMILKYIRKNNSKFLNLSSHMMKIFWNTYSDRHASENQRMYKSLKSFNKYAMKVIDNVQGYRYKETYYSFIEERFLDKTEDDIYNWLISFDSKKKIEFSSGFMNKYEINLLLLLIFINYIFNLM